MKKIASIAFFVLIALFMALTIIFEVEYGLWGWAIWGAVLVVIVGFYIKG